MTGFWQARKFNIIGLVKRFNIRHKFFAILFIYIFTWLFVDEEALTRIVLFQYNYELSEFDSGIWTNCAADKVDIIDTIPPFAIIIPLTFTQAPRALDQINTWTKHFPCSPNQSTGQKVDLVYYFDLPLGAILPVIHDLRERFLEMTKNETLRTNVIECFNEIYFISANMTNSESHNSIFRDFFRTQAHTQGTVDQFYKLMIENKEMHSKGYRYIFYMEPDCHPIKSAWLHGLYLETMSPQRFWMRGTMMSYPEPYQLNWLPYRAQYLLHINGNAIYRFDDPCFRRFLQEVRNNYGGYAFDTSIHYFRFRHLNYNLLQKIYFRFEYTNFILDFSNYELTNFDYDTSSYIVHGKSQYISHRM